MKTKFSTYKAQFHTIPEPLQKQILIRLGFVLAFLLLFILILSMKFDWLTVAPFIGLSIYSVVSAVLLFQRAVTGKYVVVLGRCTETVETLIRKKTKSILMETDEHTVRVFLRQRTKRIPKDAVLEVYVADNAPVYEKDGIKLLHSYLAFKHERVGAAS